MGAGFEGAGATGGSTLEAEEGRGEPPPRAAGAEKAAAAGPMACWAAEHLALCPTRQAPPGPPASTASALSRLSEKQQRSWLSLPEGGASSPPLPVPGARAGVQGCSPRERSLQHRGRRGASVVQAEDWALPGPARQRQTTGKGPSGPGALGPIVPRLGPARATSPSWGYGAVITLCSPWSTLQRR